MFKKSLIFCWMLLCFTANPWAQGSGMSDKQVMEYVQMGMQQGKSQQQIATELARRGVTREQAERVKKLYEQGQKSGKSTVINSDDRKRTNENNNLASDKEYVRADFNIENSNRKQGKVNRFITTQEIGEGETGI